MLILFPKIDEILFRIINGSSGISVFDSIMIIASSSELWTVCFSVLLLYFFKQKSFLKISAVLFALIALGISDLISFEVVKPFVMRERPCWILEGVKIVTGRCGGSYGFTSNHAANAAAALISLMLSKRFSNGFYWLCSFLVILVGVSRVYLGVHFPGDILGGFVLGSLVSMLLYKGKLLNFCDKIVNLWPLRAKDLS